MTNIVKVLRSVPEIDFFHSFPYLLKFESLGKFCTNFPLDGRMSSLQNVLFFTILFFQSRDVFDYLPRLHLRTCDSLVLSGQGRKRYASSLSAKKTLSCAAVEDSSLAGSVADTMMAVAVCAHSQQCVSLQNGIPSCLQEVSTALPLHLNSTPGKHQWPRIELSSTAALHMLLSNSSP